MNSKNTKLAAIVYHNNCIDGFTAAYVTNEGCRKAHYNTELIPCSYDEQSINEVKKILSKSGKYEICYIVDFSLHPDILNYLRTNVPDMRIVVLDHHKTAFEMYCPGREVGPTTKYNSHTKKGAHIILDNDECGASLCYRYFNQDTLIRNEPLPSLIAYVKDWDLWRFEFGDATRWVNRYLRTIEKTMYNWEQLYSEMNDYDMRESILLRSEDLYKEYLVKVEKYVKAAVPITILRYKGLATYCPVDYISEVGHRLAKKSGTFGAIHCVDAEKFHVKWSLRGAENFDVSEIAKVLGGGGHKGAAGFVTSFEYIKQRIV